MNNIIKNIRSRAAVEGRSIVFPETGDPRVLKAAAYLMNQDICKVILAGKQATINKNAQEKDIHLPENIEYYSLGTIDFRNQLIKHLIRRRKHKELAKKDAAELLRSPLYFAAGLVGLGKVDGCVAGSIATTGEVIRAAIHNIGLREDTNVVSSIFLMALNNGRTLTYADCGVIPYPDTEQLTDIAVDSAQTHHLLTGQEPKVAMLSFSTKGSASHERIQLVTDALELAREKNPDLEIDGELQFDAAFVPEIAKGKAPNSKVAGKANVFIFPNLDAGNIAYKITERLAGATATGPILQGLARPMMDLSRGCSWHDIINAACVAILMGDD